MGYYARTTAYRLLAPTVVYRLIQERLTLIDLSLDASIKATYDIARFISWSFTDDFRLAHLNPALEYDPNVRDWAKRRLEQPALYWRQGIPAGVLEVMVDALVVRQSDESARCMTYGEFESAYLRDDEFKRSIDPILDGLLFFHPATRPVLWRMLIVQAHLYLALVRDRDARESPTLTAGPEVRIPMVAPVSEWVRRGLDWRHMPDEADDALVLATPFKVAEEYLKPRLGSLFRTVTE